MRKLLFIITILGVTIGMNAQNQLLKPTTKAKSILLTNKHEFAYMEFSGHEYGIIGLSFDYDNMTLVLCESREPTPDEYIIDPNSNYPWHNKHEMKITKEQADAIFSLFTSAVFSSSYLSEGFPTMGGCIYLFSAGPRSATTHSPYSKSNCGHLVNIAKKLCKCVKEQSTTAIDTMLKEIKSLTDVFISFYPCKVDKASWIYAIHKENKVKGPSVGLEY